MRMNLQRGKMKCEHLTFKKITQVKDITLVESTGSNIFKVS